MHNFFKQYQFLLCKNATNKITPIFDIIKYVTNSEHYETFVEQKIQNKIQIKKIPSFIESRWTSFCDCIIVLYETKNYVS